MVVTGFEGGRSMNEIWTAERVKRDLPSVQVKIGRKVMSGRLSGRLNQFATVTVNNEGTLHAGNLPWMDVQASWETLADLLNGNRPLRI